MNASHERTNWPWNTLALPRVYSAFQERLAIPRSRAQIADVYVRARQGDSVLDLGCGPGDMLGYLPEVDYLGIDLNARYLEEAQRRHRARSRARFVKMDVRVLKDTGERFDLVLAQGLLHHLSDPQALTLLQAVGSVMKPGGRLITLDPTRTPGQGLIARLLVSSDRGRFVRSPEAYEHLVHKVFSGVTVHVRHDLMRLPYTHLLMECEQPRP
jgi:SAM-dependent methyltransferase